MSEIDRQIKLRSEWLSLLETEFQDAYMQELSAFLRQRKEAGARLYPPSQQIFAALETTPPEEVKVVILGQDPYHNPGQAHGLCFSVERDVAIPPSLRNIYQELKTDLGIDPAPHGDLHRWAEQGVLLLNSVLTVEHKQPASHQKKGWERFTDRVVEIISASDRPRVFMLWGSYAQRKGAAIDSTKHLVLKAPHPSPLSAHRGFLGCEHFSQANTFLESSQQQPIDWAV